MIFIQTSFFKKNLSNFYIFLLNVNFESLIIRLHVFFFFGSQHIYQISFKSSVFYYSIGKLIFYT